MEDKEKILDYLDDYNKGKSDEDKIIYTDLAGTMTELTGGLMDAITYVLIAFLQDLFSNKYDHDQYRYLYICD